MNAVPRLVANFRIPASGKRKNILFAIRQGTEERVVQLLIHVPTSGQLPLLELTRAKMKCIIYGTPNDWYETNSP